MPPERTFSFSFIFLVALGFALAQQHYGLARYSQTFDEYWHISWNERFLESGIAERDSASNYISTTPILIPNFDFLRLMWGDAPLNPVLKLRTLRYWQAFWLFLLAAAAVWTGTLLCDREHGLLFAAFLLLEPTLLAHSSLVTVDLACAATILAQAGAALFYLERPGAGRAVFLGLCAGLALAAKFSALLLLPSYCLLPFFTRTRLERPGSGARLAAHILIAIITGCATVSACYGFAGMFVPLSAFEWKSAPFQALAAHLPGLRAPLPAGFLSGADRTLGAESGRIWNVVLLGRSYPHGTVLYFPVLWLFKTPLALQLWLVCGLVFAAFGAPHLKGRRAGFLVLQTAILAGYFLFFFHTQVGYRHALAFLPLVFALAALGWSRFSSGRSFAVLIALAVLTTAEIIPYSGDLIAFSNVFLQPKKEAYRYFADSNLDWGQNGDRIAQYVNDEVSRGAAYNPAHVLPGRNLFDVNVLAGVWWNFDQHRWLREHLHPVEARENTLVEFDVTEDEFARFLAAERTLTGDETAFLSCAASSESQLTLAGASIPVPGGTRALCIDSGATAVVRLSGSMTPLRFGPRLTSDKCRAEKLPPGGEAWYVLQPGRFEFCLEDNSDLTRLEIKSGEIHVSLRR